MHHSLEGQMGSQSTSRESDLCRMPGRLTMASNWSRLAKGSPFGLPGQVINGRNGEKKETHTHTHNGQSGFLLPPRIRSASSTQRRSKKTRLGARQATRPTAAPAAPKGRLHTEKAILVDETRFAPPKRPWCLMIPLQIPANNSSHGNQSGAGFCPSTIVSEFQPTPQNSS